MAADSAVRVIFLGESSSAVRSVGRLETAFGSLGRATRLLAGGLAIGLVGGLAASAKAAIEFQKQMELVHTQAGASQKEVEKMSKSLLGLARSVGTTPTTLAKGLFHVESAGLRGAKALALLTAAAKGAKIGHADLESVTNALIAAQTSGIKGAGSMAHAMGVLNAAVGAGNMRMGDLTSALATGLLPKANAVGLSLQDVTAALGTLTVSGMHADDAATRLSMAFLQMASVTPKAAKALASVHMSHDQLATDMRKPRGLLVALRDLKGHMDAAGLSATKQNNIITDVFGRRSLGAIAALLQKTHDYQLRLEQINRTTGNFGEAWKSAQRTTAFQLDRAKASITAAAIPIGQLLLPLLGKAASKAGEFAGQIQSHMPQIRAAFQGLSADVRAVTGVLGPLAMTLGRIAISPAGSTGILAVLATLGSAKAIIGIQKWKTEMFSASGVLARLGPIGIVAALGVGVLAAAFISAARASHGAEKEIDAAAQAFKRSQTAAADAAQSSLNLSSARLAVRETAVAVAGAERAYQAEVRRSGVGSDAARAQLLVLQRARLTYKQTLLDETGAVKANTAAKRAQSSALADQRAKVQAITDKLNLLAASQQAAGHGAQRMSQSQREANAAFQANLVDGYSAAMGRLAKMLAGVNRAASLAANAAGALASALGRIPTHKEVQIFMRTFQVGGATQTIHGRAIGRAEGGFIPGPAVGAPVPILAHAGEIVLNPSQQQVLGGPRFLSQLFGFRGDAGPQFASGGIVGGKTFLSKKPPRPPHHRPGHTHTGTPKPGESRQVSAILTRLHKLDDDKAYLDQQYGNLSTAYSIADENQSFVNPDGTINSPFVGQRVSELHSLIHKREQLLAKMEQQKEQLERGIAILTHAIKRLMARLNRETKRVEQDTHSINRLNALIFAESGKRATGRGKHRTGGPDQGKLRTWRRQVTSLTHDRSDAGKLSTAIRSRLGTYGPQLTNWRHDLRFLPLDEGGILNDVAELNKQLVNLGSPAAILNIYGGGSGGGGAAGASPVSGDIAALLAQIGQLKLALGIQGVQQGIIGSFAKGTLNVPMTGLALVHAGEQITPAGHTKVGGGDGGSISDVIVHITVEDGAVDPRKIRAEVMRAAPEISRHIGRLADERARSGRF